jgi:hypothetical protein
MAEASQESCAPLIEKVSKRELQLSSLTYASGDAFV